MNNSLRVFVTGKPSVQLEAKKTGRAFHITNVFVQASDKPFPEEVGVLQKIDLPSGHYDVPYAIEVYNGRLQVQLDFKRAVAVQAKAS